MSTVTQTRIDEVSQHYAPAKCASTISAILFWANAAISLAIPYSSSLLGGRRSVAEAIFLVMAVAYFIVGQYSRLLLVPKAERMRRKQMLKDAYGAPITTDTTVLYYNNPLSPSLKRLAANTLENSLFSKTIAGKMLVYTRLSTGIYFLAWVFVVSLRHDNFEVLTWITQLVFSGEIIAEWLKLEILRHRHEQTFDQLYSHFLHGVGQTSPAANANALDAVIQYECTKAEAGILLSERLFKKMNDELSRQWEKIRSELKIE